MVQGETIHDEMTLNIEDLWSGGPFQNAVCTLNEYRVDSLSMTYRAHVVVHWWKS